MRFTSLEYFRVFLSGAVQNILDGIVMFYRFFGDFFVILHYAVQVKKAAGAIMSLAATTG